MQQKVLAKKGVKQGIKLIPVCRGVKLNNKSQVIEVISMDFRRTDETAPVLIYHGLNGVYIKDYKKKI